MQLFIRGCELNVVCVDETLTVDGLKQQIADLEGISVEDQVLSFAGKPLEDENTLAEYGIQDSCTLDVVGRVLGGIKIYSNYKLMKLGILPSIDTFR